jgi:hypothetical protein
MILDDVQELMAYVLPRKIVLLGSNEADHAIPELVAFWTFLKQDYKLRNAGTIIKIMTSWEEKSLERGLVLGRLSLVLRLLRCKVGPLSSQYRRTDSGTGD